ESGLARALGLPDASELGLVLRAAAIVEQVAVDDHIDAVRAQVVRMTDGEGRRHGHLLDPQLATGSQRDLELDLPTLLALRKELVRAEALQRDDLELGRVLAHARDLERMEDHRPATVFLRVEELVRDRDRNLVAELGRADGVA